MARHENRRRTTMNAPISLPVVGAPILEAVADEVALLTLVDRFFAAADALNESELHDDTDQGEAQRHQLDGEMERLAATICQLKATTLCELIGKARVGAFR